MLLFVKDVLKKRLTGWRVKIEDKKPYKLIEEIKKHKGIFLNCHFCFLYIVCLLLFSAKNMEKWNTSAQTWYWENKPLQYVDEGSLHCWHYFLSVDINLNVCFFSGVSQQWDGCTHIWKGLYVLKRDLWSRVCVCVWEFSRL